MTDSRTVNSKSGHPDESRRKPGPPFQTDEDVAWEPYDENLWIPYRIRGSWRGGVLG
jgi:hypothetical protein